MTDFLLEVRSEEIPARMQEKAQADLARLFVAELDKAGLAAAALETFATPRRLALIARGLPGFTAAVSEETKGPRTSAPPQALEGFLRKVGVAREELVERDGVWFACVEKPGRATADVLAEAIPTIIRAFPWPKSMRWGKASATTSSLRWVRPLQGIVALLGDEIVPCEIEGIVSGAATVGHRFHHPGIITIGSAADYAEKLRLCHVIVDPADRRRIIEEGAATLAAANGLSVIPDPGLVAENAGLTEWPVPLLGFFDSDFLDVPREVIQLTLRTNQKYFVLNDGEGRLAPAFICTANIDAVDGGTRIIEGNGKVLAARLSDARFFWEQDRKIRLEDQAKKLTAIVFHEKLGTVADKVDRVAKLARWLVETGVIPAPAGVTGIGTVTPAEAGVAGGGAPAPSHAVPASAGTTRLADMAEQAARLCKADLVTGMVGEFPELQGIMGGYYARAEGLPDAVADAIRDHYKPVGQGDDVPTAPVTVAVSLADKMDTLFSFFKVEMLPTGSKDPFALRRAALGYLRLVQASRLRIRIDYTAKFWSKGPRTSFATVLTDFLHDRLGVQLREDGIRYDFVQASGVWGTMLDDRLDRVEARARALQAFVETDNGRNLIAGYKRAANILRKEGYVVVTPAEAGVADNQPAHVISSDPGLRRDDGIGSAPLSYTPEKAEADLVAALFLAESQAASAVAVEEFESAMSALARLRAPIDAFFEAVIVNDPDPAKRAARLGLLARIRNACHQVADFSRIEG